MKGNVLQKLIFFPILLLCSIGIHAQINPTTQIKRAVGKDTILVSDATGKFQYKPVSALNTLLTNYYTSGASNPSGTPSGVQGVIYYNSATGNLFHWNGTTWVVMASIISGTTNPSAAPVAGQGPIYVNSNTGMLFVWNGSAWVAAIMTVSNGLTKTNSNVTLGGNLTGLTTLNGQNLYGMFFDDLTSFQVIVDNPSSSATTSFNLASAVSAPSRILSSTTANPNIYGQLLVDADGPSTKLEQVGVGKSSGLYLLDAGIAQLKSSSSTGERTIQLDTSGSYITNLPNKTSETYAVYLNETTGKLSKGVPSGGGGGSGIVAYSAGAGAIVTATGTGVTFTRTTSSNWTISIPTGVELLSFDIHSTASESATSALDLDFVWTGSRPYNQNTSADMTDAKIPLLTTLKKITPATYPTTAAGNNPAWTADVTSAGTLRISTTEFTEVGSGGANSTQIKGSF
ncbi:MAG: hypothetical protein H7246_21825 [Phycisphaerae bacterium]|nr:hypothetical protein [Saprospiraceae bacterium]